MSKKGHFVWYELMTRDPQTAIDFYTKVTGWGNIRWDAGEQPYTLLTRNGSDDNKDSVGGMMEMTEPDFPPQVPSHFIGYISTDDVDATAERIKELGGTLIHGPADIPEVGRFAVVADPQGAVFSLFKGATEEEWEEQMPQLGDFSWSELMTTDYSAAFDFYQELFDWQIEQDMDMGGEMIYRMFKPSEGKRTLGGIYNKTADMPGPPAWLYYVSVPDINAAVTTVKENGGHVLNGPMEVPGGDMIAQCTDSEGTFFALHSSATAPPSAE